MNIIKSLKSLGFNEKEARVYIALLQTGKSTAYRIAKHSGLKKPTVYVVLEELINKGIANKVLQAKKTHFVAINPEDLFSATKSKIEIAEQEALPELKALSRGNDHKVRASYYEGMDGIKEMYKRLTKEMEGGEFSGFYAHTEDTPDILTKYWDGLNQEISRKNIRRKVITTKHKATEKFLRPGERKKYQARVKALPETKYDSNISIEIYNGVTQIVSHRYLQGVIIDNHDVARVMKQIFELVWEGADSEETKSKDKRSK